MEYRQLGGSDLKVSKICLGTMTWGCQNTEAQAHEQMDYAFSRGINFIDTAEMYPVPTDPSHQGRTEQYIGSWIKKRNNRDQVILATKVAGPGESVAYLRDGLRLDRDNIRTAIKASLQRLQTDYIDLYQLHWPDRLANFFGQLDYDHQPENDGATLLESLEALTELVKEGVVRKVGVSNETPWGLMRYLSLAAAHDLPKMVSVQNPYNLLNRTLEIGLSEVMQRENVDLLAYSPMAFGTLSGKYLNGSRPKGARLTLFPQFPRYASEIGKDVIARYVRLARQHGLQPSQMALAFVNTRRFLGSNIIGATNLEQLKSNIDSENVRLDPEVLAAIDRIHQNYSNPCP